MLEGSSNPSGKQVAAIDLDHPRQHDPIKDMPHEMGTVGETVAKRNVDASEGQRDGQDARPDDKAPRQGRKRAHQGQGVEQKGQHNGPVASRDLEERQRVEPRGGGEHVGQEGQRAEYRAQEGPAQNMEMGGENKTQDEERDRDHVQCRRPAGGKGVEQKGSGADGKE